MEPTYTVRGADGKEYGPVSLELLRSWIRERRLLANQEVKRGDMEHWAPAGSFAELQSLFVEAPPGGVPQGTTNLTPSAAPDVAATHAQIKSAGSWFYWIAGLSLVNSISAFSGASWRFIIGLGITQLLEQTTGAVGTVGLVLAIVTAGVFVVLGVFACKGHLWAFIVGMVLFALDGVIFLLSKDWLGVGFHVVVLFFLVRGVQACLALKGR